MGQGNNFLSIRKSLCVCNYCILELSTPKRMKELNESIQKHAATAHNWIDTSSLLTSNTIRNVVPVVAKKTSISDIKRRIEYYSDDDDDADDHHHDHDNVDDDDGDTTLTLNRPELQLVSPLVTHSSRDKIISHDTINVNYSPSPNNPQDKLADKIASYVAASPDGSSPDSKVIATTVDKLFI